MRVEQQYFPCVRCGAQDGPHVHLWERDVSSWRQVVNTTSGRCDCCGSESDGLVSGDEGESWVCTSCAEALATAARAALGKDTDL